MEEVRIEAADGASLRVRFFGSGIHLVVLAGGPGYVNYLAAESVAPRGFRSWFPDPRGVGGSAGGPHDMATAVADLESIRQELMVDRWVVLGHSWGSDLAVRYALDHPEHVMGVVRVAGHGLHKDRQWAEIYEARRHTEAQRGIDWSPDVHASLSESFLEWIHQPTLFRDLADSPVPMWFIAAADDIRPDWPLRQLAELVPSGSFESVAAADHNFWATDPELWVHVITQACRQAADGR